MTIQELIPLYLKYPHSVGRSPRTVRNVRYDLKPFERFLKEEEVYALEDLSPEVLEAYQEELSFCLTARGKPLTLRTQAQLLGVAKGLTRFLKDQDYLLHDPGESIKLPRKPKRLPKAIMSPEEVRKVIRSVDTRTNKGYRDRVILEILYDTAIRRDELSRIKLPDLDLKTGYIRIRGKGDKDRVVPLSQRVCELIGNYILFVRPLFLLQDDQEYLILNRWGRRLEGQSIWSIVRKYTRQAGLKKNISPHTFRHTCATHMLKNGAPIRHLQEMLGHESLESTQVYTRVTINDLKEAHARYHPSEKDA